jgi:hypothetical protein
MHSPLARPDINQCLVMIEVCHRAALCELRCSSAVPAQAWITFLRTGKRPEVDLSAMAPKVAADTEEKKTKKGAALARSLALSAPPLRDRHTR